MIIRKATIKDVPKINKLIRPYAGKGIMLFRPIYQIYGDIRDYFVAEMNKKIVGCCALHVLGKEYKPGRKEFALAEMRALAVLENYQGKKIGTKLIKVCIKEAKDINIDKITALTVAENVDFFSKFGFLEVKKSKLPQKIWQECINCPRFPAECNEVLLILEI